MSADPNAIKARWAASRAVRRKYPEETGGPDLNYSALFIENAFANHAPGETNDPTLREVWQIDSVAYSHAPEDIAALLAEVERLTDGPEVSVATGRPHPAVLKLRETRRQRDEALARIDEIEKWATDHFGDSTEFPTDLAFAFWGMPSAADLEMNEDECIDDTDLCEHGLRFGCEACAEESP